MGNKNKKPGGNYSWRAVVLKKWHVLVTIPLANLLLTIIFWQSQYAHYHHSTKGILFTWLVAGLIFIIIQLSLQAAALRNARQELPPGGHRFEVAWALIAQLALFGIIAVYNSIVLIELLMLGVRPGKPLDFFILAVLLGVLVFIAARYGRNYRQPQARLLLATGMKAVPQWVQAVNFVLFGSLGMSIVTMAAITGMGVLRYVSARHTAAKYHREETAAALTAAARDLFSILAMCVAWGIGRLW